MKNEELKKDKSVQQSFVRYEVKPGRWFYDGVEGWKEICLESEADFWSVFGVNDKEELTLVSVDEYKSRILAEQFRDELVEAVSLQQAEDAAECTTRSERERDDRVES